MKYYIQNLQGELAQVKHDTLYDTQRSASQPEIVQTKFCHFYYGYTGRMYAVMQGPQLWPVYNEKHVAIFNESRTRQVWSMEADNETITYSYTE